MLVAEPLETFAREGVIRAFGFLEAQHIGAHCLDELRHQIDAQPHRIDIPGGDLELHVVLLGVMPAKAGIQYTPLQLWILDRPLSRATTPNIEAKSDQ